jgi:hypothetical protein
MITTKNAARITYVIATASGEMRTEDHAASLAFQDRLTMAGIPFTVTEDRPGRTVPAKESDIPCDGTGIGPVRTCAKGRVTRSTLGWGK